VGTFPARGNVRRWARLACVGLIASFGLASCEVLKPAPQAYDLNAPSDLSAVRGGTRAQILIPVPSAIRALDSDRIAIKPTANEFSYLAESVWTDQLPKLIQARVIESFDSLARARAVGRPGESLSIDYQLQIDIRAFQQELEGGRRARIEFAVRLLNERNGRVLARRLISSEIATANDKPTAVVDGLNRALDEVMVDLLSWTFKRI